MKRFHKIPAWAAAGAAAALLLTGCSDTTEQSSPAETTTAETTAETTTAETTVTTAATTTDPDELLQTIGEKTEAEDSFAVHLTNRTGQAITGVAIYAGDEEPEESQNLLKEADIFAADEERILWYTPEKAAADTEEDDPVYCIVLTFADDTAATLHQFPFGDIEAGEIFLEDDMAYLKYTAISSKEATSTKDAEKALIEAAMAAAEEAAQQAAQQAESDAEAIAAQEEQPVYEEPATEAPTEAAQQEYADPNDGCLGDDALFY